MDLRERVARAVAQGMSKVAAARRYEIGLSTVKRYAARQATGTLRPGWSTGRPRALDAAGEDALRAQVMAHPDATLAEHRRRWVEAGGAAVSAATLGRALVRVGWTRTASPVSISPGRSTQATSPRRPRAHCGNRATIPGTSGKRAWSTLPGYTQGIFSAAITRVTSFGKKSREPGGSRESWGSR